MLHAEYPETQEDGYASSVVRERRYNQLTKGNAIATAADLVKVLSNQDDIATFPIFRDADTDRVNTIVLGEQSGIADRPVGESELFRWAHVGT